FGAGFELDLYYAAFRIPDLLYVLFASTLSIYVLIPFVADRIEATSAHRARKLLSEIFTLFTVAYLVLAAIIAILAPFIVLVGFASLMQVGSVSVFQFAYNLQSVPLAIIGVSYSVAAFPVLAQLYAEQKFDAFRESILTALRHVIFWSLPILALFIVIRAQFV